MCYNIMSLIEISDIESDDDLYKYSNPKKALRNAKKYLGKSIMLYKSTNKGKKYMVYDNINNGWVHFGSIKYEDYLKHNDKLRQMRYLKRALGIRGNWRENKFSPNNLSINILWL